MEFSRYTDPGDYADLLVGLPTSLEDICDIIHTQLIHPGRQPGLVTKLNEEDEQTCENVSTILARLQERSPIGLSLDRRPEDRVVNNCCGYSQLMAAILKSQGTPVRLRCGFGLHFFDGYSCDHTVVEVLSDGDWKLIDPSANSKGVFFRMYEVRKVFHFAWQGWQRVRAGEDPRERYCVVPGFPPDIDGLSFVHKALIRDMICLFGHEMQCWHCPPFRSLADDELHPALDRVAELMASPDENRDRLTEFLRTLEL